MPESSSSRRGSRLTVDDWLDAAMQVLISDGAGAIKISRLCDRLGVTKGSFYWHFADIAALMSALSDHCRAVEESARQTLAELEKRSPMERIGAMGELVSDPRRRTVEAALRAWAETDSSLAQAVVALDHTTFDVANAAFRELGFDEVDAHARATALVYVGIGYMQGGERVARPTEDDKRIFVEMLTRK